MKELPVQTIIQDHDNTKLTRFYFKVADAKIFGIQGFCKVIFNFRNVRDLRPIKIATLNV